MNSNNFFAELKRRNVYKVAVAYAVLAWLLIQAGSILFPTFEAPGWVMKVFVTAIAAGFPIALVLAWAFEMTPQGMERTEEISPAARLTSSSRRKFAAFIGMNLKGRKQRPAPSAKAARAFGAWQRAFQTSPRAQKRSRLVVT